MIIHEILFSSADDIKKRVIDYIGDKYILGLTEENCSSTETNWRSFQKDANSMIVRQFDGLFKHPQIKQVIYAAEKSDSFIGYVYTYVKKCEGEIPEYVGVINGLYIDPEYRKLGFASELFKCAKKWLNDNGINYMEISVNLGNKVAVNFWKKCGFYPVEQVMGLRF